MGSGFDCEVYLHRGAGAYEAGEETALLESLEGKRAQPRFKPPFPAVEGAWKCPTAVNNVETLCNVPLVMTRGAEWFAALGPEKNGGPKLFCVSGAVKQPGVFEAPMKVTLKELIYDYAGGPLDGHTIKAVIPGGSSVPILMPDQIDIPASFDDVQKAGSLLGSAAIMVLDDTTDMVWLAENLLHFYRHESCGKCTPCREGTDWLYRLLHRMIAGQGDREGHPAAAERGQPDQRQDAVRVRRRGGDAGADHAEVVQARVRGLREGQAARARAAIARARPVEIALGPWSGDFIAFMTSPTTIAYIGIVGVVFMGLQIMAAVMVYAERKVAAFMQQRYGPYLVGPQGPAAAGRRHPQAVLQGRTAAEGGRRVPVLAGADHLGDGGVSGVRAGAVRRADGRSSACCRADRAAGVGRQRRGAGDLRRRVDGRLRHRARRLGEQLEVLAARRPAQLGADDQLRAGLRHGAGHRRDDGGLDVAARDRRRAAGLLVSASSRSGTSSRS